MKRVSIIIFVLLVAGIALWILQARIQTRDASAATAVKAAAYRCPMHPQYVSDKSGTCPICGMKLVSTSPTPAVTPAVTPAIAVSPAQQQALGLTTSAVQPREFENRIHFTAHVSFPPSESILAPSAGKVSKVFVSALNGVAIHVHAGDPLLTFNGPTPVTIQAPKPAAIQSLALEGAQVSKGSVLCLYVDLSKLTLLGDVGGVDLSLIRTGRPAQIHIPSQPGRVWNGRLTDVYQQFNERLQTLTVKLEAPNTSIDLWQGLLATVEIRGSQGRRLSIPEDAVSSGDGVDTVFVATSDTMFEPRKVELGIRSGNLREVKRGLKAGERVVDSAIFFLDSESRLKAAAAMRSSPPASGMPDMP